MQRVSDNVFCFQDTCSVYVIKDGDSAVLIDFGSGGILDHLDDIGVRRATDILMTHHHRDQGQGLARAAAAGIRIWVPPTEIDLFARVDEHWRTRPLDNDYNLREDRFSLLESVEPAGAVREYQTQRFGTLDIYTLPTPGHTVGSVTYFTHVDGRKFAFTGDLLYAPGKVWSLAATQWTYSGVEGLAATVISYHDVAEATPDILLPSHGDPIVEPRVALLQTAQRICELIELRRGEPWDPPKCRGDVWETISPHLLRNRTSLATTYALLSDSGTALFFDFGYDMTTGLPSGSDRASRRPLLSSLLSLRRDYGIDHVEVVIPTHYHDDHVAGFNLLHDAEGSQRWIPNNMANVLASPRSYDLPCLWYDPVPADRTLSLGRPVTWWEYELTLYELPGHTLYAVAIDVHVDGRRVLATGDQQDGRWIQGVHRELLNYQYRNGFDPDDFVRSAELYLQLRPDLIISGHWKPRWVDDDYLTMLLDNGKQLADLHRILLPDEFNFGRWGLGVRILPYRSAVKIGQSTSINVLVRNPLLRTDEIIVQLIVPHGWGVSHPIQRLELGPGKEAQLRFTIQPTAKTRIDRARIGANLTAGKTDFGIAAEALIDIL